MMNSKTIGILLLAALFRSTSDAQISIDPNLPHRFDSARKSFPASMLIAIDTFQYYQHMLDSLDGIESGEAYLTIFEEDTLNLHEIKLPDYSGIQILSPSEKAIDSNALFEKRYKLAIGELFKDGVSIHISHLFGEKFRLEISGDTVSPHYLEWYWEVPMLAMNPGDTLSEKLEIPVALKKLELSTKGDINVGDILYGYCELETAVHYFRTDFGMDGQLFKVNRRFAFYFKVPINKSTGYPINRW
jgi:hypothetical protein